MQDAETLKKEFFREEKSGWEGMEEAKKHEIFDYCNRYMSFLNCSKTEREFVANAKIEAEEKGFRDIATMTQIKPGDKVYYSNRDKSMYLAVIGTESIEKGIRIIGAHVDSPRLDLKPNPLYEDSGFAYFKTHYYGGIKKYQWTTIPLAIHGVIVKTNGEKVTICIGEEEDEPIFTITDLLPHLAQEQMEKKLKEAISGEDLNVLIGNMPYDESKVSERVKLNILSIFHEKYGITEADLSSAELEVVPAFRARSLGFDSSMVAAYGQDDKVCAYTALTALFEVESPKTTSVCILSDKEEIGSMGNTGMESHVFDAFIAELLDKAGINRPNLLEKVFVASEMLSADVDAGLDPIYAHVSEKNNAAYLGQGVGLNKYTGARGKSGASDANAEFVAKVRNIFEKNAITYKISELGKVDVGGGGTIAYILANKGVDVIDCGIPVLSMHAPYEVTSKYDVYTAYRAYQTFWKE